jgi:nicotinamidase-related amidase
MARNLQLLDTKRTGLLVVDMQKKLLKTMPNPELLTENVLKLIDGFKIIERPVFLTEQNPAGLGKTETAIKKALKGIEILEKLSFSCCGIEGFSQKLRKQKIDQVVLCGIETHICIWQTAMDLLYDGFDVIVVKDCVSSRKEIDSETALNRMQANRIQLSTIETVLFELLKKAGTDEFQKISALIK